MAVGFLSIEELGSADREGRSHFCTFRKVPSQASTAGGWVDLSMAAGNPVPNYYASTPLEFAELESQKGVFHGDDKAPYSKHLTCTGVVTPTANMLGPCMLLDYIGYYPFIDGDAVGETQELANPSTTPLARYSDGADVRVMAVAVAPTTGGGSFTFTYDDEQGNSVTSPTITCNTAATNIASIINGDPSVGGGPFLPFATNSRGGGCRRITSVNVISAIGGLFALVLAKPIEQSVTREINTTYEQERVTMKPGTPRIYDGAYLNWIINGVAGTVAAGIFTGYARFAWSK